MKGEVAVRYGSILMTMWSLLALHTTATAGKVTLTPVEQATLVSDSATREEVLLLRFSVPEHLVGKRIVRSVLRFDVECRPGENISAWVCASPIEWSAELLDNEWWSRAKILLDDSGAATFETPDCSTREASCDVGRWVRSWVTESESNLSLMVRRPPQEGGPVLSKDQNNSRTPSLVIIYLPQREESQ